MPRRKMKNGFKIAFAALCLTSLASMEPSVLALTAAKVQAGSAAPARAKKEAVIWHDFDPAIFDRARAEHKFVLLDLAAVWCHWCHVMDDETYSDAQVIKMLNEHYICVRVDQDSRPDLANKYEDYGWPATIIFNADGTEIVKRAGYINPQRMKRLLEAIVKDPSPEESQPSSTEIGQSNGGAVGQKNLGLSPALLADLESKHSSGYDSKYGGWGSYQKFLDWDSCEYAMELGAEGDEAELARVRGALDGQLHLLDPAFGGVYQYSTDGDWQHPHFEKIMQMQAENLRAFSLGYLLTNDKHYLDAAAAIDSYLGSFLTSGDGAFYTSQDADLVPGQHSADYFNLDAAGRKKLGIPQIDKHIYSRENGWAIAGLAAYYAASQKPAALERARTAAQWIIANRSLGQGGFSHDQSDKAGPYLGDTLAMGRAFLALYEVTAERTWLSRAESCAQFIEAHFKAGSGIGSGYVSAANPDSPARSKIAAAEPLLDENVMVARFCNRLHHFCGKQKFDYQAMAEWAMTYLARPEVAGKRKVMVGGILLADRELQRAPLHITVVGAKTDGAAAKLFNSAIRLPQPYKRVEWFDSKEGPLPNADVELPELSRAAAFSCGNGICSTPAYEPEGLVKIYERLRKVK
jgi:uncharacterized protein YyaL (SSP411 family)